MIKTADDVLQFWFGEINAWGDVAPEIARSWFKKDEDFDEQIRDHFDETLEQAARGELDHWASSPRGTLALVVLLDQFSRNMHRDSPRAFAYDHLALARAKAAVDAGHDKALHPIERVFLYLPFEHSESLEDQNRCVALFETLLAEAAEPRKAEFAMYLDFAKRHHAIIARFNRFPHRNATLGRASTPEETEFLTQPGSGF